MVSFAVFCMLQLFHSCIHIHIGQVGERWMEKRKGRQRNRKTDREKDRHWERKIFKKNNKHMRWTMMSFVICIPWLAVQKLMVTWNLVASWSKLLCEFQANDKSQNQKWWHPRKDAGCWSLISTCSCIYSWHQKEKSNIMLSIWIIEILMQYKNHCHQKRYRTCFHLLTVTRKGKSVAKISIYAS